jgi:hypothetical protein
MSYFSEILSLNEMYTCIKKSGCKFVQLVNSRQM